MNKIYNFYIISLFEAKDRYQNVEDVCKKLKDMGHNPYIIQAYHYKSVDILSKLYNEGIQYTSKDLSLSLSQLGCFLSHRDAWKKIMMANENEVHIILEDDVNIDESISLYDFNKIPEYDSVILWRHPEQMTKPVTYVQEGLLELYNQWGLVAYAITPQFAKELVDTIHEIGMPIDLLIYKDWFPKKKVYITETSPFNNMGFLGGYVTRQHAKFKSWIFN